MAVDRPWLVHYAPGVPADATIPIGSIPDLLEASAARFRNHVALDFYGATTTYAELQLEVARAAMAIKTLGVEAGDRVALVLPNCPQHVVAFYAVLRLGAVVVEHNPLYTQDELTRQFADHAPRLIVAWDVVAGTAAAAAPRDTSVVAVDLTRALPFGKRAALRLPVPKARALRSSMTSRVEGLQRWDRLIARSWPLSTTHPKPAAGDTALLQYTGGTTGVPKGAILTHRNLLANAAQSAAWAPELKPGAETFYAVLPLFHVYGLTLCLTTAVLMGATVVLFPRFEADQVLDAMERRPCTFLPGVPPLYPRIVDRARARGVSLTSITYALAGAMSLPPAIVEVWESAGGGLLVEGYGMTESSPIVLGNPLSAARRPGSIGIPFPSTYMRVVDRDDTDVDVHPGDPGELLVRGPQVFGGYWKQPDATAAALLPGGWLRTGDVVTVDDDGFVRLVDRIKELILVGGFNVYPSEVEAALLRIDGVSEAAVTSVTVGDHEQVVAAVVADADIVLDLAAVRAECRQHLAGYKVPSRIVQVDALPRSTIGKVLRTQVRAQVQALP